jgi:hypothetical protein
MVLVDVKHQQPIVDGHNRLYRNIAGGVVDIAAWQALVHSIDNGSPLVRLVSGPAGGTPRHGEPEP